MARTIRNKPRDNQERSRPREDAGRMRRNMRAALREVAKLTEPRSALREGRTPEILTFPPGTSKG